MTFSFTTPSKEITFNFGTGQTFKSTEKPDKGFAELSFSIPCFAVPAAPAAPMTSFATTPAMSTPAPAPQTGNEESVESEEVSKLDIDKTGEEDEEILFDEKCIVYCKGYEKDKDNNEIKDHPVNQEIGNGKIHINKGEDYYRILMRRGTLQTLIINTRIMKEMKPVPVRNTFVRMLCPRLAPPSEGVEPETKIEILTIRFQNEEIAKRFIETIEMGKPK